MVNKITTPPTTSELIGKVNEIIDDKQDTISDLATIRSGATGNVKLNGAGSQQTIALTSGSGTTALGVKSASSSSYISFSGSSGWLASFGIGSDKKPTIYDGSSHTIAYTSDIPTVNNASLIIQKNGSNVATFTANASSNVTANISVPTNTNELTNGAGYITLSALSGYQTTANLVTSVSSSSTNSQYPSAKCVYDIVGNIESALATINSGGISTVNLTVTLSGFTGYFESFTINNVTYTSGDFTNDTMTIQIPKDTSLSWSAEPSGRIIPSTGTINTSVDYTLQIYIHGGKD